MKAEELGPMYAFASRETWPALARRLSLALGVGLGVVLITRSAAYGGDYAADRLVALADFAQHGERERLDIRYLSLHAAPENIEAGAVLAFWIPHLSPLSVLQRQIPQRVGETRYYRIRLSHLGWTLAAWKKLAQEYPYSDLPNPLFLRGDWLVRITSDTQESTAYYDLLYAKTGVPRNRVEFLKRWKVNLKDSKGYEQAVIIDEGHSRVARRTRLAVYRRTAAGYYWETFDSRDGAGANDPLARLAGGLKYDASELIASIPKIDAVTGRRVSAQAYLLVDGAGNRLEEADPRIVVDHTDPRLPVIRTPGSCVRCHVDGINALPENAVRASIRQGVEIFSKKAGQAEEIERLYLGELLKPLKRNQEDFADFVTAVCALPPQEVVDQYARLLQFYDTPLDLEQAARETGAESADELRSAIGLYAERQGFAAARLAALAHGRPTPRKIWELETYEQAVLALVLWRSKP